MKPSIDREKIQGYLILLSITHRKWKITAYTPSETDTPKYILEFYDVRAISGEYWEVTEEWFETFYKKLKTKRIELTETFVIERVENPDGEETEGTYIAILCASRQEPALGWLITRIEDEETGILVGICPEAYVSKIREQVGQLQLIVEFVKRPNTFRDITVGISP